MSLPVVCCLLCPCLFLLALSQKGPPSVEAGVKVGPLFISQPHSLPEQFPSSPPGQFRSATARYPKSGWSTFLLGSGPGRSLYSSRVNLDLSLISVGHGGGAVISARLRTASSPHAMERRSCICVPISRCLSLRPLSRPSCFALAASLSFSFLLSAPILPARSPLSPPPKTFSV